MTVEPGQRWRRRGSQVEHTVLALLPGYVRLSVTGHQHPGAYIDIPHNRFGLEGPYGYEQVPV